MDSWLLFYCRWPLQSGLPNSWWLICIWLWPLRSPELPVMPQGAGGPQLCGFGPGCHPTAKITSFSFILHVTPPQTGVCKGTWPPHCYKGQQWSPQNNYEAGDLSAESWKICRQAQSQKGFFAWSQRRIILLPQRIFQWMALQCFHFL